ncbi:hypothetical protein [Actinoplanes sp. NPDC051851]|uniref:hypothetical protein n=1 Tax=Actinoplanes sp. NPDC051851 TaxID=3154753 RepID=UPI00341F038F
MHDDDDSAPYGHDLGLSHDLPTLHRRGLLGLVGGGALTAVTFGLETAAQAVTSLKTIPEETQGPYPADGSNSNGLNVLKRSGIVRSDIRKCFGSATGTAAGIPLTVKLKLLYVKTKKPAKGLAVYLWQCNRDGGYSLYSSGLTSKNYLRGVQVASKTGYVTFKSIFPACYSGRWPHIHFEVYPSLAKATSYKTKLHTSQLAMPADVAKKVFATTGYSASVTNFAQVSLSTDNVFKDGYTAEMPALSGSVTAGYTATLTVGV